MDIDKSLVNFNTNQAKSGKSTGKPRVLVAPLDWGLGHSTRCIPVIKELLCQDADVFLAGNEQQAAILGAEFPDLPFLNLPGYNIRYGRKLLLRVSLQVPRLLQAIRAENRWLREMCRLHEFDAVIADNRYGLYHPAVPCVFITHQLLIRSPFGRWSEKKLQQWNYKQINRFTACWVPDREAGKSLAGELSHPAQKPAIPIRYLGPLSRFEKMEKAEKKNHLLIILSGPEPQRTILEDRLIDEIVHYNGSADIVRALPLADKLMPSTNQIRFYNHLPARELNEKMQEAGLIISRCGYSTVMDITKLQKKSILIPTRGQTEQEYLAAYLSRTKTALCIDEDKFSLSSALEQAATFQYNLEQLPESSLAEVVRQFITLLKGKTGRGHSVDLG